MRKKVLIIPFSYPRDKRPNCLSGNFFEDQAIALSKKYDVMVCVPQFIDRRNSWPLRLTFSPQFEIRNGIKILPVQFLLPVIFMPVLSDYYAYVVKKAYKRISNAWGRPDIIHAHVAHPSGWLATQLGQFLNVPVVITEHTGQFSLFVNSYQKEHIRQALMNAEAVISVSPSLAKDIRDFIPSLNISIIGNIVVPEFFSISSEIPSKSTDIKFLTVAVLNENKGIAYLIEAASQLKRKGLKFQLIIGGEGPIKAKLINLAKLLGVFEDCVFTGHLSREYVRKWMDQCDVFVLPSLVESFGLVLAEAMARGKPVISTHSGGADFVVTPETGILVNPADSSALAGAMEDFIMQKNRFNPDVIRQIAINRFSEDAIVNEISTIYEKLWK